MLNRILLIFWALVLTNCNKKATPLPLGDKDNGGLFLPIGFTALMVVDSIGPGRHLAVKGNGDIYLKLRYSPDSQGGNVAIRDTNGDGKADVIRYFGDYRDEGGLANGMTIYQDHLYFSSAREVYRQRLDTALVPASKAERIVVDDHSHGTHWHITKPMAFDGKGNMYVPFGAPSNACMDVEESPGGIPGLSGRDPCPELERHGGIWRFKPDELNQTQEDGELFATGIRSVVAMNWSPLDDHLYVVMHGRDNLHRLFPNLYSQWQSALVPAEEFLKVTQGADFGWPYCYYDQLQEKKVLAPEYGGNGKTIGRCANCDDPVMGFPGHWAPNDLHFYEGDQFPERYKQGAFIAFHGSTNRAPYPQAGYFVAFIPFRNGVPTGDWEVFADGFARVDPIVSVNNAVFRPMGIATGPDGSLYISDSNQGSIWRIIYSGNRRKFGAEQLAAMEARKTLSHLRTPDPEKDNLQKALVSEGMGLYQTYCLPCHQADGKGAGSRFPPLAGTKWVTGDRHRLMEILFKGMEGEISVNGMSFNGVMPSFNFLSDHEAAILLTFIRQNFGNEADSVGIAEVSEYRKFDNN